MTSLDRLFPPHELRLSIFHQCESVENHTSSSHRFINLSLGHCSRAVIFPTRSSFTRVDSIRFKWASTSFLFIIFPSSSFFSSSSSFFLFLCIVLCFHLLFVFLLCSFLFLIIFFSKFIFYQLDSTNTSNDLFIPPSSSLMYPSLAFRSRRVKFFFKSLIQ
jgi:hypothetical protein